MSDANQRLTAWTIETDTGKVREILDDLRMDMLKHYEAATASLCEMETKARQTLNSARVHTIMYVPYLSHARQLYKLSRQQGISGASFALGPRSCSRSGQTVREVGKPWPGPDCPCPTPHRGLRYRLAHAIVGESRAAGARFVQPPLECRLLALVVFPVAIGGPSRALDTPKPPAYNPPMVTVRAAR